MTDLSNDRAYREWVEVRVKYCQTVLVDELLKREVFLWENVENIYDEEEEECKTVFEWWIVDRWLLEALEKHGAPVLRSDFGSWWGRTETGQYCRHDGVLQEIFRELKR